MSSGKWTWIGGLSAPNQPGVYTGDGAWPGSRRAAVMWVTQPGSIYLFGGISGRLKQCEFLFGA